MNSPPTLHVTEVEGDLLTTPAEALVNAWNRNFIPRLLLWPQGVSGALKKQTGPEPWRELARMGTLEHGAAVVTSAGKMTGPTFLIHVAGLNTRWKATTAGVTSCARNAVEAAAALPVSSIAMPLIGAGTGGLSDEESRHAIRAGLDTFPTAPLGEADLAVTIVTWPGRRPR